MVSHVRHEEAIVVVAAADVCTWGIITDKNRETIRKPPFSVNKHLPTPVNPGLTFAGLHAFNPVVVNFFVANTSKILVPSTDRSATTDSP